MRTNLLTASIVSLLAAGCGSGQSSGPPLTAGEARDALPSAQQVQVGTPPQGSALTAAPRGTEAVTAPAEYAADTLALALAVNGGVAWTLGIAEAVVSLPPTSCALDTCTWGPGSAAQDLDEWQLVVTRKDTADYLWSLQGRPRATPGAAWIPFLSGEAFTTGVRHVGHGTVVLDLDAAAGLARRATDPAPQPGKISASYDNRSGGHVAVQFLGTQADLNPDQRVNAAYQFDATSDGGDLQVATLNLTTAATLQLHTRWTSTGAGRADAAFSEGGQAISRSQCWDGGATLFRLVFQSTGSAIDLGTEALCAFVPAAPPTIVAPPRP